MQRSKVLVIDPDPSSSEAIRQLLLAAGYAVTVFMLGVFTAGLFWLVTRLRGAYPALPLAAAHRSFPQPGPRT